MIPVREGDNLLDRRAEGDRGGAPPPSSHRGRRGCRATPGASAWRSASGGRSCSRTPGRCLELDDATGRSSRRLASAASVADRPVLSGVPFPTVKAGRADHELAAQRHPASRLAYSSRRRWVSYPTSRKSSSEDPSRAVLPHVARSDSDLSSIRSGSPCRPCGPWARRSRTFGNATAASWRSTRAIGVRSWCGAHRATASLSRRHARKVSGRAGMPEGRIYAGLDIGTTKITAIVAEVG